MTPAIGTVMACRACGRDVIRIDVNAPWPHQDWIHVDGPCGRPAVPWAPLPTTEEPGGQEQGSGAVAS